jgi:hypothetical protein
VLATQAVAEEPAATAPPAAARVPYLDERGQEKYQEYLGRPLPRAFAISPSGAYGSASGTTPRSPRRPADPKLRALELCRESPAAAGSECVLYAVDNEVVFGKTASPAGSFGPTGSPPSSSGPVTGAPPPPPGPSQSPYTAAPAGRDPKARARFVGEFLLEHQFNAVATVSFSDGSQSSLGDALLGLNAGAAIPLTPDGKFEIQGVAGLLFARINATNGDAIFWDFPVEITAHANLGSFRLGAGPVLHISPMLRGNGFASGADVNFATNVGAVARAEYHFQRRFGLGLHLSWQRLSANGASIDATRLGGFFNFYL